MVAATDVIRGRQSALNQTGSVVIKAAPGRISRIIVNTAVANVTLNDCATTGAAASSNLIFAVPNTVGIYDVDFPFQTGLVLIGGAGAFAINYD